MAGELGHALLQRAGVEPFVELRRRQVESVAGDAVGEADGVAEVRGESASIGGDAGGDGFGRGEEGHGIKR